MAQRSRNPRNRRLSRPRASTALATDPAGRAVRLPDPCARFDVRAGEPGSGRGDGRNASAARSPDPQPASCRRPFRRGFRARAAPSTRHRWCPCPRPDQQPLSGCVGRDVLAGACAPTPGPAGAVPVRVRSRSSAGLRWTRGRLWHPRRQHRPLRTGLASGDRCKGRRFGARRMYVPGILSSQPSQACLPSHGTVPERRANVQKGARLSGRRPKVFGAVTRLGWLPKRRRYALACLMSLPKWPLGRRIRGQKSP